MRNCLVDLVHFYSAMIAVVQHRAPITTPSMHKNDASIFISVMKDIIELINFKLYLKCYYLGVSACNVANINLNKLD